MSKHIRFNNNNNQSFYKARATESTKQIMIRESMGGLAIAIFVTLWRYFFASPRPSFVDLVILFLTALVVAVTAFGIIGLATRQYYRKKLRR